MLAQQLANGVVVGSGYALAALGLALVFGILQFVNFAHGALYALGAYVTLSGVTSLGLPYALAVPLAMVAIAAFAVACNMLFFLRLSREGELGTILGSLGLMFVVVDGIRLLWGAQARSIPTPLVDTSVDVAGVSLNGQLLLGVGVAALLIGLVFLLLNHTWLGLRIRALAQDETAARLMGMRITWSRHATWAIAGALTGAAGSVIVPAFALQPSAGDSIGLTAFAVVILGGLGSLWGAVIASLTLGVLESLTEGYIGSGLDEIVAFTALVAMLLVRPQGLAGRAA